MSQYQFQIYNFCNQCTIKRGAVDKAGGEEKFVIYDLENVRM